jgi:preprotein translocase subunit SecD
MKKINKTFIAILLLTILGILVVLPSQIYIPKPINKTIKGFKLDFFLGSTHIKKDLEFKKGLDLEGGTTVTLKADMKSIAQDSRKDALESAKTVIEQRINLFGVSEPIIQTATTNNDYRIIVDLPGVTDVNQAVSLIGTTAELAFWEEGASGSAELTPEQATSSAYPLGITQLYKNPHKTDLGGRDLQQSTVAFDPSTGQPQVKLTFTNDGAKKFEKITERNVNKRVAFALDNVIVEAPNVNQVIRGGDAVISGSFTTEQAKQLAIQLNAGALPVPLSILEQHSIGATLGQSSLEKSLFAGVLGFIIVVVFMVFLYRRYGWIASFALVLYTIFVLAIFKLIPITLTLAGIAGFILSIGMAVDANILIFERMREELRRGKPRNIAIELGFSRAWNSIRDSNVSSLITSFILYYFGSGMIKGFALTLAIGVLVSMFSAIVVTRTFLRLTSK